MKNEPMRIAIDFDGTLVTHEYPNIGIPLISGLEVVKELREAGHQLILWTMRSGKELDEAVQFCRRNGIEFDEVNRGINGDPWTDSPKAHANIYIDDMALGCPLVDELIVARPYVNWKEVRKLLVERGAL